MFVIYLMVKDTQIVLSCSYEEKELYRNFCRSRGFKMGTYAMRLLLNHVKENGGR